MDNLGSHNSPDPRDAIERLKEKIRVLEDEKTESDKTSRAVVARNAQLIDELKKRGSSYVPPLLDLSKPLLNYRDMTSEVARLTEKVGLLQIELRHAIIPPPGFVVVTGSEDGGTIGMIDLQGREVIVRCGNEIKIEIYIP